MNILTNEQKAVATVMDDESIILRVKNFNYTSKGAPPGWWLREYRAMLETQAEITYPIAVRETLKMVGEWLEEYHEEHSVNNLRYQRKNCDICINRLKAGTFQSGEE